MAREPLMPTSQSLSDRQVAASLKGIMSASLRSWAKPVRMASEVIDCSQRRLIGFLFLKCWTT